MTNDLTNASSEAFDHALVCGCCVFNFQGFANNVEGMLAGRDVMANDRVFFLDGEAVHKLAAIVRQ